MPSLHTQKPGNGPGSDLRPSALTHGLGLQAWNLKGKERKSPTLRPILNHFCGSGLSLSHSQWFSQLKLLKEEIN